MFYLLAGTTKYFCTETANVWQVVGWIMLVFKIIIPLLLIIFGMLDLGKAVTSNKEDEIKKATGSLMRRAIAAVVIFFIPTLVGVIMNLVDGGNNYKPCAKCISNPMNDDCGKWAENAWKGISEGSTESTS